MKKFFTLLFLALCFCFLTACKDPAQSSSSSSSSSGPTEPPHQHNLIKNIAQDSSCTVQGNVEFYFCFSCRGYFLDEAATQPTSLEQTRKPLIPHVGEKVTGFPASCGEKGLKDHWACTVCFRTFADEDCSQSLAGTQLEIPTLAHANLAHHEGYPIVGDENGQKEHWTCSDCNGFFLTADGTERIDAEDIILYSAVNIPDFIVEIPSGRDPIVLQLTDTQIIDGSQTRATQAANDRITYAPEKIKKYCYDYITEIITATTPDLIIITGDLIYGKYDDNGSALKAFIDFMETFKIPWAPIFGNHEAESHKGVDWQCEQLENATYCLFEQKQLMGNGNYSVGIRQNGAITRVFYMLDSNGYTDVSSESLSNGHTTTSVGFAPDQIAWYTEQITQLKALSPQTKISFAYHIQQAVFGDAYAKYGFDQSEKYHDIYIDYLPNKTEGDFGYIGRQMKSVWDTSKNVYEGMKALGVDSVFVGHEHCNSASVVYEGIRFQYGQKSSQYDRYNGVTADGEIVGEQIWQDTGNTPLVGGSVIVLSQTDGTIQDAYIYYCKNAGGNIDWDSIRQS